MSVQLIGSKGSNPLSRREERGESVSWRNLRLFRCSRLRRLGQATSSPHRFWTGDHAHDKVESAPTNCLTGGTLHFKMFRNTTNRGRCSSLSAGSAKAIRVASPASGQAMMEVMYLSNLTTALLLKPVSGSLETWRAVPFDG
jgi:hypothetical protein